MPEFLCPIHESNDCHAPAGSPAGGEFCSGGGGTQTALKEVPESALPLQAISRHLSALDAPTTAAVTDVVSITHGVPLPSGDAEVPDSPITVVRLRVKD